MIPEKVLARLTSNKANQRATGIDLAVETIKTLQSLEGLRGFEINGEDDDAVLEVIEKSGLGSA